MAANNAVRLQMPEGEVGHGLKANEPSLMKFSEYSSIQYQQHSKRELGKGSNKGQVGNYASLGGPSSIISFQQ